MDFYFENHGANTYLVYAVKPEDTIDTLSLGMLTNNKILGLAQTRFTQMDADKFIQYNVSSHISVKRFFEGPVNKKRLLGVFRGIVDALLSAEDYMIDPDSIIIDLNYMFADVSTCDTVLICWPIISAENRKIDLGAFFKEIMFSTQFDQTDNCDYVAKIINYLNSATKFSPKEFKDVLESMDVGAAAESGGVPNRPIAPMSTAPKEEVHSLTEQAAARPQITPKTEAVRTSPAQEKKTLSGQQHSAAGIKPAVPASAAGSPQAPQMAVPGQKTHAAGTVTPREQAAEREISWFYLMQHYNKENAAAYKAQKEAKKGKKTTPATAVPKQGYTSPATSGKQKPASLPFAVPSQQPTPGQRPDQPVVQVAPQPAAVPSPQAVPMYRQPVQPVQATQTNAAIHFGETTVLGGAAGETTVLGVEANPISSEPYLLRAKTGEKIALNKPVFRIGKERSYVDYFISDNTAISRSHANIINRSGELFVLDTNSTNHTYVNGLMIPSNEEVKLAHGAKIRLANEDFELRMY
ncbi:MAG: DUF6382 domain-containing protein [Firmicutes bacterium]|nr:DUF6382 domain-containing protein [Bacillota bacterium]